MEQLRITKEFDFEMAHALYNHDGHCKHIHGHSYKLAVTILGQVRNEFAHPHDGMVMDFGQLKQIIKHYIIDVFDHAFVVNEKAPYQNTPNEELYQKMIKVSYQPTCENMVLHFVDIIKKQLPPHVQLVQLKLNETATSFAEWRIE